MRIDKLNTLLVLQADATTPQGAGRSAGQAWSEPQDVASVWASVQNRTGREVTNGAIATATGQYDVTIRWRGDVTGKSRFAWRRSGHPDRFLYVVHVPMGTRTEYLTIQCEEGQ